MQVMTRRAAITGPGAPLALAAAALFGASTPLAKLLLGEVAPWLLAGLLYFGSGIGLAAIVGLRALAGRGGDGRRRHRPGPVAARLGTIERRSRGPSPQPRGPVLTGDRLAGVP